MDLLLNVVIGVSFSVAVSGLIFLVQSASKEKEKGKEPTLQDRISNLTKNLESSVAVITEIETEISKRKNLAQQLEADIERYDKLKDISRAQVEAIAQTLKIPLEKESRKSLIRTAVITFVVTLIFFTLGYLLGGR